MRFVYKIICVKVYKIKVYVNCWNNVYFKKNVLLYIIVCLCFVIIWIYELKI